MGGKNRKKTCRKLAQQHARIAHIRYDTTHKLTSHLCKNHAAIAIEDLCITGMLKNHQLAQAVADSSFGEIRRQITYKTERYGSRVIVVNRFYPSSKTCSACGWIDENLTLADRTFVCQTCGLVIDRDLNAAINLIQEALRTTGSSSESHACGESSSGFQEPGSETALGEAGTDQLCSVSIKA